MRFKKGDTVEVMDSREMPVSWHIREVVSSGVYTYRVRCVSNGQIIETVPLKSVRPLPPPVQGLENCSAGDIVELFHENSWKPAVILKIMEKKEGNRRKIHLLDETFRKWYLIRLLGSSHELVVNRRNLRIRQAWCGGKWIVMGKGSEAEKEVVASKPSTSNCYRKKIFQASQQIARAEYQSKRYFKDNQDDAMLGESSLVSSRSLKRRNSRSTVVEAQNGRAQKLRAIEKEGMKQRVPSAPLYEKVDVVGYSKEILGETDILASHNNFTSNGHNQMERIKQNDVPGYNLVRSSELNNSDSDASSVGSCSLTKQSPGNYYGQFRSTYYQETDTSCSDAESSNGRETSSLPPKEVFEVSMLHRLELHAYRCTLEALYASGTLSWEQESLLTDLRITLHISNDEHLQELRHLISQLRLDARWFVDSMMIPGLAAFHLALNFG
ncbi:uncharacterized protein LOC127243362 [Andrographis paniculata]|uniref:uncharacterized protein LOC127243362 n=1 Tax=Andrographis paniculata TaxID=175694 RepID=UPI0021E6FB40|nr:uncharacterized protein LOC127243362 [Andrographis paniculata]XP_051119295.1 uncharacterized protein LOC127243362 [Andrographis paniculata]